MLEIHSDIYIMTYNDNFVSETFFNNIFFNSCNRFIEEIKEVNRRQKILVEIFNTWLKGTSKNIDALENYGETELEERISHYVTDKQGSEFWSCHRHILEWIYTL